MSGSVSTREPARGLYTQMRHARFALLLASLLLIFVGSGLLHLVRGDDAAFLSQLLFTVPIGAMLLSAVFAVATRRGTTTLAVGLAVLVFVTQVATLLGTGRWALVASNSTDIIFMGFVVVVILRFIFASRVVTFNLICAALCVYLLLGVLWASTYSLIEVIEPNSFKMTTVDETEADALMQFGGGKSIYPIYFSLVTMTTLGYGDITPVSPPARIFVVVQALVGQLYLAVLVARLVGMHVAYGPAPAANDDET